MAFESEIPVRELVLRCAGAIPSNRDFAAARPSTEVPFVVAS